MPGLPLQPPGDTPCTLRLGALAAAAAAALAAAARAAFPALLPRAGRSEEAAVAAGGGGGSTPVSLPLEISFCFPRRLTHPLPFLRKGDLFPGTGKNIFSRRGWVAASGSAASLLSAPPPPPSKTKKQTPQLLQHPPSLPPPPYSTAPSFALSPPNYFIIMLPSLGGLVPLRSRGSPGLPWMPFLKIWEPGSEFSPRRV